MRSICFQCALIDTHRYELGYQCGTEGGKEIRVLEEEEKGIG